MIILGIQDNHNASVALVDNGKVVYALSEERISRVKNTGGVPCGAIQRLFIDTGLTPHQVDCVAVCGHTPPRPEWYEREQILQRYHVQATLKSTLRSYARAWLSQAARRISASDTQGSKRLKMIAEERMARLLGLGFDPGKIKFIDHHQCHAAAAYYSGGISEQPTLILTNDGGGDGLCGTVSIARGKQIQRLAAIPQHHSFAALYSRATFQLGLLPLEHEYKVMGMAPYGNSDRARKMADELLDMFEWPDEHPLLWRRKKKLEPTYLWGSHLERIFRFCRFDDISLCTQLFVEHMALKWIRRCLAVTGAKRVVLGGGLFMNVKLNKSVLELPEVDELFVMPSCGDESNSIGAAYDVAVKMASNEEIVQPLGPLYLGVIYSDETIRKSVQEYGFHEEVEVTEPEDLEDSVAQLLAGGEVIARYAEREEFGARALGNRSILSDPSRMENIVKINKMIKQRDFWMPFAGSMLMEDVAYNLENPKRHFAPYMIMTLNPARDSAGFRAATHPHDGTIRPQMVVRDWNPGFYRLIQRFQEITGRRDGVLNTSFNLHGFPLVSSPTEAIDVFEKSGLRVLAIGPFLIRKK